MFNLLEFILEIRSDLRFEENLNLNERIDEYFKWLITSGIKEYKSLPKDKNFREKLLSRSPVPTLNYLQYLIWTSRQDIQVAFPLENSIPAYKDWFYTHGLEEYKYGSFLTENERSLIISAPLPWRDRLLPLIPVNKSEGRKEYPFGVNIIGYAYGQLGIGEDARMAARSLLATGVPVCLVNFNPGLEVPQSDYSMKDYVVEFGKYSINIFCLTAEEHGRYVATNGYEELEGKYNIGYWPWELSQWPIEWASLIDLVDEVWVSTKHIYNSIQPLLEKPLHLMPMAVDVSEVRKFKDVNSARDYFNLDHQAKLFCFSFDLKSSFERKNPKACIESFNIAFPKEYFDRSKVGLVIKVHKPSDRNVDWEKLVELAEVDDRIYLIIETLPRPELLALYQSCNCFLSLHRAEGFGRGLAEALQLGLHLITTGYSGNLDFCAPPNVDLIDFELIKIEEDQYPHSRGQYWADPKIAQAAMYMRKFVLDGIAGDTLSKWEQFSLEVVGDKYNLRLLEILNTKPSLRFPS